MDELQRDRLPGRHNVSGLNARVGESILVLGAGNFGTCLAQHAADKGYQVTLYTRDRVVCESINTQRRNPKYLTEVTLSSRVKAVHVLDETALLGISVVIQAVPTQAMRGVLAQLASAWRAEILLVCAAKGIELGSLQLPLGVVREVLGAHAAQHAVVLSGPSFAAEVAARQPTCVVAASHEDKRASWAQGLLHAAHFRVYTSSDPIGLEVAGALKNVVAIAAGATAGIGFQMNSRAALITRGLAEITRIGAAMGANPLTFTGLGGVGDLFLTCTSEKSRNFRVGYNIGRGEALDAVLKTVGSVAEGVATAGAAYRLAANLGVEAPIIGEVYRCLFEGKPMTQAVMDLLTREAKPELTGISMTGGNAQI